MDKKGLILTIDELEDLMIYGEEIASDIEEIIGDAGFTNNAKVIDFYEC